MRPVGITEQGGETEPGLGRVLRGSLVHRWELDGHGPGGRQRSPKVG